MASNPLVTIEVDTKALLRALDQVGHRVAARVKLASKITADNIVREAKRRVPKRTGETASHIVAEETHNKEGYIVWVEPDVLISHHTNKKTGRQHTQRVSYNALGGWLEFGTQTMTARQFLFNSARLEEGAHLRRIQQAVGDAIEETGLGD